MNVTKIVEADFLTFRLEIGNLAGNQFATSRGDCYFAKQCERIVTMRRLRAGNDFERDSEQRVAGEDGNAVAKNFVTGGTPAAEIVVVHAREIVVDERIGVDAFHRASEW